MNLITGNFVEVKEISKEKVWKRNCPKCGTEHVYKQVGHFNYTVKHNLLCVTCVKKNKFVGKNNPFYGKHHSERK